ncbi:unnamed protein product [Lasius platythorax]|uniref:Uncharacterized protein n=1 Tax=Lasius platythorax TaxID=488582 RepID=A0AAV2PBA2_9HYME
MNGHTARRNGYLVPSGRTFRASILTGRQRGCSSLQARGWTITRMATVAPVRLPPLVDAFFRCSPSLLCGKLPVPVSRYSWSVVIHPA